MERIGGKIKSPGVGAKDDDYFLVQRDKSNNCRVFLLWIIVLSFMKNRASIHKTNSKQIKRAVYVRKENNQLLAIHRLEEERKR